MANEPAGSRFACPGCKKVLTIPDSVPAGHKVKCPACQTILTKPGAPVAPRAMTPPAVTPLAEEFVQATPAPPQPLSRVERDRDDDRDDERRRSRPARRPERDEVDRPAPRRSGSKLWLVLILFLLLIGTVIGVGGFVWPGFFRGGGQAENELVAFAPANSIIVGGANLKELRTDAKGLWDSFKAAVPGMSDDMKQLLEEAESAVYAASTPERAVVIVRSRTLVNPDRYRLSLNGGPAKTVGGKTIYPVKLRDIGEGFLAAADDKTLVFGPLPETEFLAVLASAGKKPALPPDTLAAVQRIQGKSFWMVVANEGMVKPLLQGAGQGPELAFVPGAADVVAPIQKSKNFSVWQEIKPDKSLKWHLAATCADGADAALMQTKLTDISKMLIPMGQMFAMGNPAAKDLDGLFKDLSNTFKVDKDGPVVIASLQLAPATVQGLQNMANQQLFAENKMKVEAKPFPDKFGPDKFGQDKFDFDKFATDKGPFPKKPLVKVAAIELGAVGPAGVTAQGRLEVNDPPDPVRGGRPHKLYSVKLQEGMTYAIDMKSKDIDSFLRLEDAGQKQLAADDDSGGYPDARIVFNCVRSGDYRVIATVAGGKTGAFTLSIKAQEPSPSIPLDLKGGLAEVAGELTRGDAKDRVRGESACKVYTVKLTRDKRYQIDMMSDKLDSYLRLEDESEKQLAFNDDGGDKLDARIVFAPPRDGAYRIIATTFRGGVEGPFRLKVQELGPGGAAVGQAKKSEPAFPEIMQVEPPQVKFQPYVPKMDKEEIALPGPVKNAVAGGAGRYLVLHVPERKELAIFDVQDGKIARTVPLAEEAVHIAAGAFKLVVIYPNAKLLRIYDLATGNQERSAPLPEPLARKDIHQICMGEASHGPLFAYIAAEKRTLAMDLASMTIAQIRWNHWSPTNAYGPLNMAAAPDGNLLVGWGGGWAGLDVAEFRQGRQQHAFDKFAFSGGAYALPSADSRYIFAPGAMFDRGGGTPKVPELANCYVVPAHEPGFFLALHSPQALPVYGTSKDLPPIDMVTLYSDARQKLFAWSDCKELATRSTVGWERRVHYYPQAGLLVTVTDKIVLRRAPK